MFMNLLTNTKNKTQDAEKQQMKKQELNFGLQEIYKKFKRDL